MSDRDTASETRPLLEVEGLRKYFFEQDTLTDRLLRRDPVSIKAVDGVSFHVDEGETLGLVGESGCGKSTTGETILQLQSPTEGRIEFDGEDLLAMTDRERRAFRERAQVVFQDPFSSLDPRMTAGEVIAEPLVVHDRPASDPAVSSQAVVDRDGVAAEEVTVTVADDIDRVVDPVDAATVDTDSEPDGRVAVAHVSVRVVDEATTVSTGPGVASVRTDDGQQLRIAVSEDLRLETRAGADGVDVEVVVGRSNRELRRERAKELLERVGLAADQVDRYPHEFSGGQRQRIGIARALALDPEFILLDEPVSALDVSVQAQVLNLLEDLQEQFGLTYLFIAHDLSVVRHISDRVAVMYLGRIVETGAVDDIFENPRHPYTEALLESVPRASTDEYGHRADTLRGDVPSPRNPPSGCRFHTRCPYAKEACRAEEPATVDVGDGQETACFRAVEDHPYWDSEPLDHAVDGEES